ncbi:hypothetical protein DFH09DRAFT_1322920 [Mycena vulgaris]|nr:hypothetical protein DFH09DRAFT_1322920 [Mycena vulgaris]
MSCAYHVEPVVKRPKKILTEEEKQDAKMKREINKMLKESRGEWEATLPAPWVVRFTFLHPVGTRLMFKSDAKKAFGLTEGETLALRHESALQQRKIAGGVLFDADVKGIMRALESTTSTGRRRKPNFREVYDGDAQVYEHLYGATCLIAQTKKAKAVSQSVPS